MLFRPIQIGLLALAAAASILVYAAGVAGEAMVMAVHPTRIADLVMLDAGFEAGLRPGMICHIMRGDREIAEVILVQIRPNHSAALIANIGPRQAIRVGDSARIKLLRS